MYRLLFEKNDLDIWNMLMKCDFFSPFFNITNVAHIVDHCVTHLYDVTIIQYSTICFPMFYKEFDSMFSRKFALIVNVSS